MTQQRTKIVTVTGCKGGIGKSTTAIHLAEFISRFGKTLLIDCDPNNRTSVKWMKRGRANGYEFAFDVVDDRSGKLSVIGRDYLIIDTPANPNNDDFEMLSEECDLMILPVYPDANSVESLGETVQKIGGAVFRGLVSMSPAYPNRDGELTQKAMTDNDIPVFKTIIRRTVALGRAAEIGCSVKALTKDKQAQALWKDYEDFGREVMTILKNGRK